LHGIKTVTSRITGVYEHNGLLLRGVHTGRRTLKESVACTNVHVWDLTFILLTWRIWWVPNNASRWQMGFNSAFKGL